MRLPGALTFTVTSTLGMTLAPYAISQDYAPANLEAVTNYCFYGGTLYSVGARLCVPGVNEGSFTLVCKSKDEDNDASKTVMLFGVLISDHRRPIAKGARPNFERPLYYGLSSCSALDGAREDWRRFFFKSYRS